MPELRQSPGDIRPQIAAGRGDRALAALAHRQHGVVARRQFAALGVSESMVRERVRAGRLLRIHRGVYAVGHRRLRREGYWLAAVLAVGPDAALSHREAAALHGIRPSDRAAIDVTTIRRVAIPGIQAHRVRALDPADRTAVEGIPVTTVERTLVDLAAILPPDRVARALSEAERLRCLDVPTLERALRRTVGRCGPGHRALRTALKEIRAQGATLTRSILEDKFLELVSAAGLPTPRTNVYVEGHEVDAFWPASRLIVELDGYVYHRGQAAFRRDRARDVALTTAGYRILRFVHDDVVRRPGHVVEALRRLDLR